MSFLSRAHRDAINLGMITIRRKEYHTDSLETIGRLKMNKVCEFLYQLSGFIQR